MTDPRPQHWWNDPDGDGHDCVDCPADSIWKCDEAAHHPTIADMKRQVMARLRVRLLAAAASRRLTTPKPRGLA